MKRKDFIRTQCTQIRQLLKSREVLYREKRSKVSESVYFTFHLGKKKVKVRVSDHRANWMEKGTVDVRPGICSSAAVLSLLIKHFRKGRGPGR